MGEIRKAVECVETFLFIEPNDNNMVSNKLYYQVHNISVQVSLVIRGRYVPSFWTTNPEFVDKKSIFN